MTGNDEGNDKINNTQEMIITAASRIMTAKGIKSTSLSDIAKDVGISKGTLYYYYASKNDIIFDITEKHLNQISTEMFALLEQIELGTKPSEIIKIVFTKILAAETRDKLHFYLISDSLTNHEDFKNRFKEKYRVWREMIEEGLQKVLQNKVINYNALASLILAAIDGFTLQSLIGVEKLPIDDISELLASLC
jgi:AcrR family transcriptional regulator